MSFRHLAATAAVATFAIGAPMAMGTAHAAPCTIGTCEVNGGPLGVLDVGIQDENVPAGAYNAEGSFEVAVANPGLALVDVNFDGQSGTVPSGFSDLTISFEQDAMDLGSFAITDDGGFQILTQFVLAIASTSDVFFEISGTAFNDLVTLPDYNITMSSVPVPAALPLLLSGLAGLGFAARSKRRGAKG